MIRAATAFARRNTAWVVVCALFMLTVGGWLLTQAESYCSLGLRDTASRDEIASCDHANARAERADELLPWAGFVIVVAGAGATARTIRTRRRRRTP